MKIKLLLSISIFVLSLKTEAQNHFIRTDLLGFTYPYVVPEGLKPVYGTKYSIGYEQGFKNPHFSVSLLLNFGYTASYGFTESGSGFIDGADTRKGTFIFTDIRYYPFIKKRADRSFKNISQKGLFIAPYVGLFYVKEGNYNIFNFQISSGNAPTLKLRSEYYLWEYGAGMLMGYKQIIRKKFFLEGLFGAAFGWSTIESIRTLPSDERDMRFLDLWRLELAAGYAF